MTEPKKPRGRPPKPEAEKMVRRAMYLPPDLWEKIDTYKMEWLRSVIKRAKGPVKK